MCIIKHLCRNNQTRKHYVIIWSNMSENFRTPRSSSHHKSGKTCFQRIVLVMYLLLAGHIREINIFKSH